MADLFTSGTDWLKYNLLLVMFIFLTHLLQKLPSTLACILKITTKLQNMINHKLFERSFRLLLLQEDPHYVY